MYPLLGIATTLAEVENSTDSFQSSKKSDEQHHDVFESELAAQQAYAQATVGAQTPNSQPVPITSSIRRTLRYLYYLAGPFAPWRGVYFIIPITLFTSYHRKVSDPILTRLGANPESVYIQALVALILNILRMPFNLTWTHHVISQPLPRSPRRGSNRFTASSPSALLRQTSALLLRSFTPPRLPPWSSIKYMLLPTILATCLEELDHIYPQSLIHTWILKPTLASPNPTNQTASTITGLLALAFFLEATSVRILTYCLACLAGTLRTRVEASLLPDDVQTTVPMDRNFGLKEGRERRQRGITLWEAWQTMTWGAVWRVAKVYAKSRAIGVAYGIGQGVFWGVIGLCTPGFDLRVPGPVDAAQATQTAHPKLVFDEFM